MPEPRETYVLTLTAPVGRGRLVAMVLKYADKLGLKCVDVGGPPDPQAWVGWARRGGEWAVVCSGATEALARELLAGERGVVLRKGECPKEVQRD